MSEKTIIPEPLILRDHLALDRTKLANERTLLAYLRTAIMLLVSAVTVLKLLHDDHTMVVLGWVLLPLGLGVGVIGAVQFFRTRQTITDAYSAGAHDSGRSS